MPFQIPFSIRLNLSTGEMSAYDRHVTRHANDMKGYFHTDLQEENPLIYEYFECEVPEEPGQIVQDITIVYPGTVHGEYFMTKGHYHANEQCSEVYLCLSGEGYLIMQTKSGEWDAQPYTRGTAIYVPPRWAHRSVNTGSEPLVLYALYPANSGHDYDTISEKGFLSRLFQDDEGKPLFVPNSV